MGAMIVGLSSYSPPLGFILKYGRDTADRVYDSLISLEGMDDEVVVLLHKNDLRESDVGFLLNLSDRYLYYEIHSILSW
jgi:hypothetical protein